MPATRPRDCGLFCLAQNAKPDSKCVKSSFRHTPKNPGHETCALPNQTSFARGSGGATWTQGLGCGVGRALGIGVPLGVGVGLGVAVGVGVAVAVAVGVGVAVGGGGSVAVGVGVGP